MILTMFILLCVLLLIHASPVFYILWLFAATANIWSFLILNQVIFDDRMRTEDNAEEICKQGERIRSLEEEMGKRGSRND